tara:strand:- start:89 stop:208 length:120 start_codon:yes stop_codon:yes gene_type:complete
MTEISPKTEQMKVGALVSISILSSIQLPNEIIRYITKAI